MNLQDSPPQLDADNSLTLRYDVQESDLRTVRDIVKSTGFFYPAEIDVAVELVEERLRRGDASGYFFAFAEIAGRVVGYACYGPIACTTSSFDIYWIAVHSDAQRHGLGQWLMSVTEKLIFEQGGERIYVETSGRDHYLPTRKFYDRCGYLQVAELPEFYGTGDSKIIYLKSKPDANQSASMALTPADLQPGTPPDFGALLPEFRRLCEVVARLRAPDGCPWDREQTMKTIKPYTLEETYELLEAIDADDNSAICEELGDVLLQVILDSQIAADEQRFFLTDVVRLITDKMIRRHPHVFGNDKARTTEDVKRNWHLIKEQEKPARDSQLDGIPVALPELARAARITARAAAVGYDFPDRRMLFDKLKEELSELAVELFGSATIPNVPATVDAEVIPDKPLGSALRDKAESELGDVLFVLANIGRRWGINPEEALRRSNAKFSRRFQAIEDAMKCIGRSMHDATLREMEDAYQAAKRREPGQRD
ncbi:MAG: nucleoside triphosphate pyrophosphohydrolase [Planctomycetaceae bacterium]|nr:nucleoside triphosphate pyrophosphohydrolase [Planctomycetaceae bacterium]